MKNSLPLLPKNSLCLIRSKTEAFSLKIKTEDGASKTIHSLYDPKAEAKAATKAFKCEDFSLVVILGLGLGYHLIELIKRLPNAEYIVVEASPEIFELAKNHGNIPEDDERVQYLVGMTGEETIKEITRHQIKKGMLPVAVFSLSSLHVCFPQYYQPLVDALHNICSVRIWEKLKYSKFTSPPYRIGLISFDYFLIQEVENAIKGLGHEILKIPILKTENSSIIVPRLIDKILTFKPDFFLTINHWGFDEEGALTAFMSSINMPVASWYVDSPNLIVKAFDKNASDYTSLFLWDEGYIQDMRSIGFEAVCYLPLATDENIFKPLRQPSLHTKIPPCDIGFVGNSMVGPANESISKVSPKYRFLIGTLAEEALLTRASFNEHLNRIGGAAKAQIESLGPRERINLEAAVLWKTTQLYRLSCIKNLKPFGIHIYGDKGWQELLDNDFNLFPSLSYYTELPYLYNSCKVNLNATSIQMGKAVNQRVFDVPACGAFLLTDDQAALADLFDIGREVAVFQDPEEIPELVTFYLNHPKQRELIAFRGRERILKEHTYRHRLEAIVQHMKSRYG